MPLTIQDDTTEALVLELARRRGVPAEDAVRMAVRAALDGPEATTPEPDGAGGGRTAPLRERFSALRAGAPLPPATGRPADKAFFDGLSDGP